MTNRKLAARFDTLVALDLLQEFLVQHFFAEKVDQHLVDAMTRMVEDYIVDMEITNIKLQKVAIIQCIPVLTFVWTDVDKSLKDDYSDLESAMARIEYKDRLTKEMFQLD